MNDNVIVTASDLNSIAVDLGATTFSKFGDGVSYAVDKLNEITGDLVSAGILNIGNKCECTLSGNSVSVNTGKIVFSNGAKITIDTAVSLELISTTETNYVYAINNPTQNKAVLEVRTEELTDGDFVKLCEVSNGVIVDKRVRSMAKVLMPAGWNSRVETYEKTLTDEEWATEKLKVDVAEISKIFFVDLGTKSSIYAVFDVESCKFSGWDYECYDTSGYPQNGYSDLAVAWDSSNERPLLINFESKENDIITFGFNNATGRTKTASFDMYFFGGE